MVVVGTAGLDAELAAMTLAGTYGGSSGGSYCGGGEQNEISFIGFIIA